MSDQRPITGNLPSPAEVKRLIGQDQPEEFVRWADQIGQRIARQVTTSQIRNVFGTVRQIEMNWRGDPEGSYRQAVLLKPKLGYAAARERGQGLKDLEAVLVPALDAMMEAKPEQKHHCFNRFVEFFEAILAYHKKYGGN